jgi:hypothetical protein
MRSDLRVAIEKKPPEGGFLEAVIQITCRR